MQEKNNKDNEKEEKPETENLEQKKDESPEKKPDEKAKERLKKPEIKKTEAVVKSYNLPVSTKYASAICKFIKHKRIEKAIEELELVIMKKKAVPVKGEIPHRKGKGMMSGRYPKNTAKHFIILLKSLQANSNINNLEEPIISEAVANIGSRPYGKFGRIRKKRTNIKIIAREINKIKENGRKKHY